jgi:uncharacterized RDD family membrane protein YckC
MYCSKCGTPLTGSHCGVCGTPGSTPASGDSITATRLSGWWRRVGATVVDNFMLVIPSLLVFIGVGDVAGNLAGALASIAVQGLYMVMLLSSPNGQTIGNRLVGTRVRDALTGQALTTGQAFRRWAPIAVYGLFEFSGNSAITILVAAVASVDYLHPLFNERRQTLHDRLAGTIVVMN